MEEAIKKTYKDKLISEVLNKSGEKLTEKTQQILAEIRRDTINRPVIFAGKSSCGIIAGANATYDAVKEYLDTRSIDAELLEVGCGGFCAAEPVIEVQLPGRTRVAFQQVLADHVDHLLDQVFNNILDRKRAVAQYRNTYYEAWEGVPFIDELAFFAFQKRIVLDQCGLINPDRIEDYLAREGYQSFLKCIRKGAGAFVCGEETALISTIEGRRGMPSPKPPYPSTKGLFGKPTIVNNVETLANVSAIIQNGPQWFTQFGTDTSKGTKLFSLTGKVENTGLIEVEMGTTLQTIIEKSDGGIANNKKVKALNLGGPTGSSIPSQHFNTPVCFEALNKIDTLMGSGGMVVLDDDSCMVDMAKFFMDFIRKESCGKCIPCREGTLRIYEILENITRRPENEASHQTLERFKGVMQLEELAQVLNDTSLCGLGKTAANPVLSTMKWFRHEYGEHIFDRNCRAGVCKQLRSFHIDVDKCTGCTICAKKCPVNAIIGSEKGPHFIIEEKCMSCGICLDVCKFSAVFVK